MQPAGIETTTFESSINLTITRRYRGRISNNRMKPLR